MEIATITSWTFTAECAIPGDLRQILVEGELPWAAYKTSHDSAIFTNKRLIVRDAQGISGKKVDVYSLPYSAINMWSSENTGRVDLNTEMELWTRAGHIRIKLGKGVDIGRLDLLISHAVLNG